MFSFFTKKKKEVPVHETFNFQFRVSYKLSNGNKRETCNINLSITAKDQDEAAMKLEEYVMKRVKISIYSVQKNIFKNS